MRVRPPDCLVSSNDGWVGNFAGPGIRAPALRRLLLDLFNFLPDALNVEFRFRNAVELFQFLFEKVRGRVSSAHFDKGRECGFVGAGEKGVVCSPSPSHASSCISAHHYTWCSKISIPKLHA